MVIQPEEAGGRCISLDHLVNDVNEGVLVVVEPLSQVVGHGGGVDPDGGVGDHLPAVNAVNEVNATISLAGISKGGGGGGVQILQNIGNRYFALRVFWKPSLVFLPENRRRKFVE